MGGKWVCLLRRKGARGAMAHRGVRCACNSPKVRSGSYTNSCLAKVPEYAQIAVRIAISIAATAHPILSARITS